MHPQSPYIYGLPLKVRDYEVDSQGIVNNANYLHYLEHTRHEFCQERGISFRDMQRAGIDPVVRKIELSSRPPLRLAEELEAKLWMERRGARFIFHQDIFNAKGKEVVRALVHIVCIENGRISRGDTLAEAFGLTD